jgi:hypothetical protein
MYYKKFIALAALLCLAVVSTGCATRAPKDYTDYLESKPASIVVLPPVNNTVEVQASNSVLSYVTRPLAEAGYYVMPVALVSETFQENGLTQPQDMHAVSTDKLRQFFGADAALYIQISQYGTSFQVLNSVTQVTAEAKLVDLKNGKQLWTGKASARSAEGENQQNLGLAGLLISAIVKQVIATASDQGHKIAGLATGRLLSVGPDGLLLGPRSPNYGKK